MAHKTSTIAYTVLVIYNVILRGWFQITCSKNAGIIIHRRNDDCDSKMLVFNLYNSVLCEECFAIWIMTLSSFFNQLSIMLRTTSLYSKEG